MLGVPDFFPEGFIRTLPEREETCSGFDCRPHAVFNQDIRQYFNAAFVQFAARRDTGLVVFHRIKDADSHRRRETAVRIAFNRSNIPDKIRRTDDCPDSPPGAVTDYFDAEKASAQESSRKSVATSVKVQLSFLWERM